MIGYMKISGATDLPPTPGQPCLNAEPCVRAWRGLGEAISVPPGGVRGGKLLRGYTFYVYLSTGLTRRSLQRGGFNGYAVIPPTPGDPLRTPLATLWKSSGTPWGPLGDRSGTPWGPCGDPLGSSWCPKRVPRAPQERHKSARERSRALQESQTSVPRGLGRGPRALQEAFQDAVKSFWRTQRAAKGSPDRLK